MPDISRCFGPMINSPLAFNICSLVEQKSKAICKDVSPEEQNNPLILGKINESAECTAATTPWYSTPWTYLASFSTSDWVRLISGLQGDKGSKVESQGISGLLSRRLAYSVGNHAEFKVWIQSFIKFFSCASYHVKFRLYHFGCSAWKDQNHAKGSAGFIPLAVAPAHDALQFWGGTSHADSVSQASLAHDASHSFKSLKMPKPVGERFPHMPNVETCWNYT